MLFNSPAFLCIFLPAIFILYHVCCAFKRTAFAILLLGAASLVFYGWDRPWQFLPVILASMSFNYVAGACLAKYRDRRLLGGAVAANLALLAYYKYAGFFASVLPHAPSSIALPLGISFFTLTQIAYLVDAARGEAPLYKPHHYLLFVTFFPHLLAGPILYHKEIIPQFSSREMFRFDGSRIALGLSWLAAGLFKKVALADSVSTIATPVFTAVAHGTQPSMAEAWGAALAYMLQIYFDFSGYSDMAVGLGLLFGIRLPLNFNSPYQSSSCIEFWQRWHMTLSRFLRDYLYIPLGGNRKGQRRRYINLMATMLIGGFWHGASWNFILWGGLHGTGLAINHIWRASRWAKHTPIPAIGGWALTFLLVLFAWVPFRAATLHDTGVIWSAMAGAGNDGPALLSIPASSELLLLVLCVLFLPNTQKYLRGEPADNAWLCTRGRALLTGAALGIALALIAAGSVSEFLYFRF